MPTFLVFRDLPGITRDQYLAAQRAIADETIHAAETGKPVHYLTGFFIPADAAGICLFDGPDAHHVEALNRRAGVPFANVVEVVECQPHASQSGRPSSLRTDHP